MRTRKISILIFYFIILSIFFAFLSILYKYKTEAKNLRNAEIRIRKLMNLIQFKINKIYYSDFFEKGNILEDIMKKHEELNDLYVEDIDKFTIKYPVIIIPGFSSSHLDILQLRQMQIGKFGVVLMESVIF